MMEIIMILIIVQILVNWLYVVMELFKVHNNVMMEISLTMMTALTAVEMQYVEME
jgi:hypothetical protein